jgi:hypothetical protein
MVDETILPRLYCQVFTGVFSWQSWQVFFLLSLDNFTLVSEERDLAFDWPQNHVADSRECSARVCGSVPTTLKR